MRQAKEGSTCRAEERDHGQHRVQPLQNRLCHNEQAANARQREYLKGDLPQIDRISGHCVEIDPLRGAARHRPDHQKQRGPVQKDDGQVGEAEEPGAQEGVIPPKASLV
jgi:hypothetical protein